jgi:succinate dehydrogenase / fumarate reductase, cytochrome b subunit
MSASIDNPHFLLRRLHSLLGLVPVGVFLVFHLWENSQSRFGAEHYNGAVFGALQRLNYLPVLEILLIALPLVFHAGYGLAILRQGRAEPRRYAYLHNRLYWLQRVSGLGILAFLLLHVGLTRIQGIWEPAIRADLFAHMQAALSQPWMLAIYVVGLLLAVFHLANGLWSMAIVWGVTASARAQTRFGYLCAALGLVLAALGVHGIIGFLP